MNENSFSVRTAAFEGPLDLLLSLVEERKLYINEVSLAEVADAYLSYVQSMRALPMQETAQFILTASTLLLIKSRSLLPQLELTQEEESGIADLTARLERYALVRKGARLIGQRVGKRASHYPARSPVPRTVRFDPGEAALPLLAEALARVIAGFPIASFAHPEAHIEAVATLEETIARVRTRVTSAFSTRFSELTRGASRADVILHFLALLELVKGGFVGAEQGRQFDDIVVESQESTIPRYGMHHG